MQSKSVCPQAEEKKAMAAAAKATLGASGKFQPEAQYPCILNNVCMYIYIYIYNII